MPPVKFDDLQKTAHDILNDDYQTDSFQFKAKQKTSFGGAVSTTTVDLFSPKDSLMTSSKLSWKFPKPLGILGLSIDKLEMDKAGKFKLEAAMDKDMHSVPDLKLEGKSDLKDPAKFTAGFTYTGITDTQVKFETKAAEPQDFSFEITRAAGKHATLGLKGAMANITRPEVGIRLAQGPFFGSFFTKKQMSVCAAHACYRAAPELNIAGTYEYGGKDSGSCSLGLLYNLSAQTKLKAKLLHDKSIHTSVKHEVAKGFTTLFGAKWHTGDGSFHYGLQVSIE